MALGEAVEAAARQCLPSLNLSAAARQASWQEAVEAAEGPPEQQYAALQPPVRVALWSLRLLAGCTGAVGLALRTAAQLFAVADNAGGAQLLLLLQLLPAWTGVQQLSAGHCDALLHYAARRGLWLPPARTVPLWRGPWHAYAARCVMPTQAGHKRCPGPLRCGCCCLVWPVCACSPACPVEPVLTSAVGLMACRWLCCCRAMRWVTLV